MLYSVKFRDKIFDSIAHVDETSRIQTVKPNHEYFYRLLDEFEKLTGLPMLLNTSLNNNGRPIAGKPEDVFALLKHSDLDFLVVGDCVYGK
jgi:carbamoyltransferase